MNTPQRVCTSLKQKFLSDYQAFHVLTGRAYTTISMAAIRDPRVWNRLHSGGTITVDKLDEFYDYMNREAAAYGVEFDRFNPTIQENNHGESKKPKTKN